MLLKIQTRHPTYRLLYRHKCEHHCIYFTSCADNGALECSLDYYIPEKEVKKYKELINVTKVT